MFDEHKLHISKNILIHTHIEHELHMNNMINIQFFIQTQNT